MRPSNLTLSIFVVATILLGCIARNVVLSIPHGTVIHFLDVGQGDAALIVGPRGEHILIDGGPDLRTLEQMSNFIPSWDHRIDLIVLTHPHLDHLFAFPEVLRRYAVGAALLTGVADDLSRYREMLSLIKERNVRTIVADPAHDIDFGDGLKIDVLWPPPTLWGQTVPSANDTSVVLKLTYHNHCVMFSGDMEEPAERAVMASHQDIRCDILKVAHHGSKTSSGTGWLLAVQPKLAVISVGAHNTYGHPSPSILRRFGHFHIPYKTTIGGTVTVRLDDLK